MVFSSCLYPTLVAQQGTRTVKEGEVGVVPLRLHVADRDLEHTPAWKAKYTMEGDTGGNFKVETDPVTNDGILTVIKVRQTGGMPIIFTQPHLGRLIRDILYHQV